MYILYNYPPKGRWIVVDIYRDAKRRGIYPPLFTDPSRTFPTLHRTFPSLHRPTALHRPCFSIYQIRRIKKRFFNFFFWNFREKTRSQRTSKCGKNISDRTSAAPRAPLFCLIYFQAKKCQKVFHVHVRVIFSSNINEKGKLKIKQNRKKRSC